MSKRQSISLQIVDFHNSVVPPEADAELSRPHSALQNVLSLFNGLDRPVYHMIGNHCLYCHTRPHLNATLGIDDLQDSQPHSYYVVLPYPGWRFVVLDGYDVSLLGWPSGHELHERAKQLLDIHNPNTDQNSPEGLVGLERRFVKFGGGASAAQLAWLDAQLAAAKAASERVIVCCHLALHPATAAPVCLLWNYDEVLEIVQAYPGTVVATLAGHAHRDGYHRDEAGIHHRVCAAILETPPGIDCFGVLDVYGDRILVNGHGAFASQTWEFR